MQENKIFIEPKKHEAPDPDLLDRMVGTVEEVTNLPGAKFTNAEIDKLIGNYRQLTTEQKATFIAALEEIKKETENLLKDRKTLLEQMNFVQKLVGGKTASQSIGDLNTTLSELEHLKNVIKSDNPEEWEDIMARDEKDKKPPVGHEKIIDQIEILSDED